MTEEFEGQQALQAVPSQNFLLFTGVGLHNFWTRMISGEVWFREVSIVILHAGGNSCYYDEYKRKKERGNFKADDLTRQMTDSS